MNMFLGTQTLSCIYSAHSISIYGIDAKDGCHGVIEKDLQRHINTQSSIFTNLVYQSASPSTSSWSAKPLVTSLSDVFLPSGYPQSVSDDYLP